MRKTKVIATIGPASETEEVFAPMVKAGVDIARLNFSHGTDEEHRNRLALAKHVRKMVNCSMEIMLDTKGPEYRIGYFEKGRINLKKGDRFTFTIKDIVGDETKVSVSYPKLCEEMQEGDRILVNNGLVAFRVVSVEATDIVCVVEDGGELSDRKSMNFPGKVFRHEYLSEADKEDILFGIRGGIDMVAASFVSKKEDIEAIRTFLHEHGGDHIKVIAKIENRMGVENLDEICQVSDGIMIARGDLGVEIPFMELPMIQKQITRKCRELDIEVITATEMLESMIYNVRPTRAEVTDVANAIYDGTTAIMLSGETAAGKYPVEAVKTMVAIARVAESNITNLIQTFVKVNNVQEKSNFV